MTLIPDAQTPPDPPSAKRHPRLQSRLFWLFALVTHALFAGTWYVFMPGGFPLTHPRFLANRLLPLLLITLCTYALISARRHRPGHTRAVLLALSLTWLTASLACRLLFPTSSRYLTPPSLLVGLFVLLSTRSPSLLPSTLPRLTYSLLLPLSLLAGILAPWTQRAPSPQTHPLNLPPLATGQSAGRDSDQSAAPDSSLSTNALPSRMLQLSPGVRLQPSDGQLTLSQGRLFIYLQPFLTFVSRSPDRCWVAFAPPAIRKGPPRHLTNFHQDDTSTTLTYHDDTASTLCIPQSATTAERSIPNPQSPPAVSLTSFTTLPSPIYSHLNTYTELLIAGHSRLFLEFSPCPGHLVEVAYQEYPTGRPARLAYVTPDRTFHVVQATSAEKGPYHDLTPPGTLPKDAPLTITFYDTSAPFSDGAERSGTPRSAAPDSTSSLATGNSQLTTAHPIARLTLDDFSSQLSTQLSPTAGWLLPANSIEFSLQSDRPSSAAAVFLSLASTSPGRGYDSIGHSPGTYRNRLHLQLFSPPSATTQPTTQTSIENRIAVNNIPNRK